MTDVLTELGDITQVTIDAIVNAANEALGGGGGVDGAIHAAAGPQLIQACLALPDVTAGVRCPTGEARITPGFELPARYIIHAVGPRYSMGRAPELLESAFVSSLTIASDHDDIRSVGLPAISCGIYGYPVDEAAKIARVAVEGRVYDLDVIRFVLFSEQALTVFSQAFTR